MSRYKNLLHHYIHQHGRAEASTFWAGCGAIRRDVFSAVGGFDESYLSAAVEDIEFGTRLRRGGYHIRLCPDIQVTHLKRWTFVSLLPADIFRRAVPWSRLILRQGHWPRDLNVDNKSRLSALSAWAALFFLGLGFASPSAWWGLLPALTALGVLNAGLYRFFWRQGGHGLCGGGRGLARALPDLQQSHLCRAGRPAMVRETVGSVCKEIVTVAGVIFTGRVACQ